MSNISILIACYPKVGSQFLRRMLAQRIVPPNSLGIVTTTHAFNLDWLKNDQFHPDRVADDTKIIYLYANPMNSVLSLLKTFMSQRIGEEYQEGLTRKSLDLKMAQSYSNLFACGVAHGKPLKTDGRIRATLIHPPHGGPPRMVLQNLDESPVSFDAQAWTGHTTLIKEAAFVEKELSDFDKSDLSSNFVSYMINGDVLGYKNHFDLWTKKYAYMHKNPFCMLKYESLTDPATLRQLQLFLGHPRPLQFIEKEFRPRKTDYSSTSWPMLENSYGHLSEEMAKLPAFKVLHK